MIYRKTIVLFGMMDFCPPALGRNTGRPLQQSIIPLFQALSSKSSVKCLVFNDLNFNNHTLNGSKKSVVELTHFIKMFRP